MLAALAGLLAALSAGGCTGEDATPIVPGEPSGITTPHRLEPTEQMQELAEQQCLDDPTLSMGEVNAVDPANPDQILATVTVDCDTVR
jgi:hypothetical protein